MRYNDQYLRKQTRKQKIFWLPFETEKALKKASETTGLTQTELVRRGIELVTSQEKVAV
jgi:predicted DNA-binding protein